MKTKVLASDAGRLTEKAMLVSLSISYWTGKISDDSVEDELTKAHATEKDVHEYKKRLVNPAALKDIKAARSQARSYLRDHTSPWLNNGTRILSAPLYFEVTRKMGELHSAFEEAVIAFKKKYPSLKTEARKRMGSLYREEDFPSAESLTRKFGWEFDAFPIPTKEDWRLDLGDKETAAVKRNIEQRVKEALAIATRDLWQRLFEVVEKFVEKMKDSDAKFHDSIVENIRDLVGLLPKLNVADDPKLEEMRKKVEVELCHIDPDSLRDDPKARKQKADAADEILQKMRGYIGNS